jgi:hypothetical protein
MATPGMKIVKDGLPALVKSLETLAGNRVMVGVPGEKADRKEDGDEAVNNAALMYIHENGDPASNLPARPVVHPTVKANMGQITKSLKLAGAYALSGDKEKVMATFTALGLFMQNALRQKITDGPFAPLSPRTIAQRAAKRGTKRRKGEQQYLDLVSQGVAPSDAQQQTGIKPLIDTGQLRRALTYVIRRIGWSK